MSNDTSSSVPPPVEYLKARVAKAAETLHKIPNMLFGEGAVYHAPTGEKYIWDRLAKLGIYQDDESFEILTSSDCTEGEARRVFCENGEPNLPPVRFKRVWSIMKGTPCVVNDGPIPSPVCTIQDPKTLGLEMKDPNFNVVHQEATVTANTIKEIVQAITDKTKPVGQWSDDELLAAYTPDCDTEIVDQLDKKAQNKPFVIFANENTNEVNVEATKSMLKQARKGRTPVHFKVGTSLKRLHRAGQWPSATTYECPFDPHVQLLETDGFGFCDTCNHSWDLSKYENMQFARIVYELGQAPKDKAYLRQFIQDCNRGTLDDLAEDYPQAMLQFNERKAADTLPRLKRRTSIDNRGHSDPMQPHQRY